MFESIELPHPDEIAGLSDADLVDAMAIATLMEKAAIEVRFAALEEMCERQACAPPTIRLTNPGPQAELWILGVRRASDYRAKEYVGAYAAPAQAHRSSTGGRQAGCCRKHREW